jgi:hypothetical protein
MCSIGKKFFWAFVIVIIVAAGLMGTLRRMMIAKGKKWNFFHVHEKEGRERNGKERKGERTDLEMRPRECRVDQFSFRIKRSMRG